MRRRSGVRGGRRRRHKWSKQLLLLIHFYFHPGKSLVHLSRKLQRGSGGANLAVHMSAPRALWPPLRTVIEETRQTFFTQAWDVRSNAVNSQDVWPLGPHRVQSCQSQAVPTEDGVTTRGNLVSALTFLLMKLSFFDPKDKIDSRLSYFKGMCFCNLNLFGTERPSKFLRFPCAV
jgi:hypothetical protein